MPNRTDRRRRLEVFIGSTFREHKLERDELIKAIYNAGHIPSGMELWDADSRPLEETLKLKLQQCDVHVLLVGADYGALVPEDSPLRSEINYDNDQPLSYTHWEYLKSEHDRRPLIAFVSDLNHGTPQTNDNLKKFRDEVTRSRFCKHYTLGSLSRTSADDAAHNCERRVDALKLSKNVISALNEINANTILAPDSAGWIRADSDEAFILREIQGNRFLRRIMERLRQFDVLTKRVLTAADEKAMAADLFWKALTGPIRRAGRRKIFFESGSTLAFVTERFEHFVLDKQIDASEWKVWTNNVESLLQMELYTDVEVVAFPSDAPDPQDKYGAIFDQSFFKVGEAPPTVARPLYGIEDYTSVNGKDTPFTEQGVVKTTTTRLKDALSSDGGGILCVTASGLETKQSSGEAWKNGPHTGSHANMLLKRAAFTTGQPTVIFLHEDKIGRNFKVGKCYPVFMEDLKWKKFKRDYPVALCVGYQVLVEDGARAEEREEREKAVQKRRNEMFEMLGELGFSVRIAFEHNVLTSGKIVAAVICSNEKFQEILNLAPEEPVAKPSKPAGKNEH